MIPLFRIRVEDDVREAIDRVLESGRYVLGEETRLFEEEFARYIGVKYAVATSSGTSSLFLILKALNISDGDEVIVPSYTFIASISPVLMVNAKPVFVDVDYDVMTIDPGHIEERISSKTKAIIVVHLFGHPANLDPIIEIADKYGLYVIEDAAEAHGAMYKRRRVGSYGYVGFFSFYPTKNLPVYGDGGMVVTNDRDLAEKIRLLRHHGQVRREEYRFLGYNMKMSEIHAAIGRVELRKLDSRNERRRKLARIYDEELNGVVEIPVEKEWAYHVYHLYTIKSESRDKLARYLMEHNVETGIYYQKPANKYEVFNEEIRKLHFEVAERLTKRVLSLPMSHNHTEEEILTVSKLIREFFMR